MALIRLILFITLFYIIFRLISKALFPFLYNKQDSYFDKEKEKKEAKKKEGEITIQYLKENELKHNNSSEEEYTDYEEIE
ncbi:MAG: hypothetical protein GXO79_12125 [Chlorobi bacterium]|nr:hypothetical protein [Chlorobiota bacterium]